MASCKDGRRIIGAPLERIGRPNGHLEKKGAARFHFKSDSYRLLIQAQPSADHELRNSWKRYVQLSAQREWSERLGMPRGGPIEA